MASIHRFRSSLTPLAAAVLALAGAAHAQDAAPVQSVQITARNPSDSAGVTGFNQPLSRTPIQADVIDLKSLQDIGAISLSDLTRLDASVSDSYNAPGYWTTFAIRGFQVDNRYNFRRDGLPINAETVLPMDSLSSIEILKGLSGAQSGTSAPGGLVNLVVKRPDADLRDAQLRWSQNGTVGAAVDLSQRFGADRAFGARLNVSADRLDPNYRDAKGHRQNMALAADWRIDPDHTLELEFEHNLQSQPSVPAFSMLGDVVPDPHSIDPHINLNDQPWSLPVVTQGNTMSLRYTQSLNAQWRLQVQALQQRLVSNDHLAFAFGGNADCEPCDRFASDGTYALYDFRSDDERRLTRDLDVHLSGEFDTGTLHHALTAGVLESRFVGTFDDEAYNFVGIGNIAGTAVVPSDPSLTSPNVDRTERNTELYLRDSVQIGQDWSAWGGVRHTSIHRRSWETSAGDPTASTDYTQSFTTPWLALSRQFGAHDMAYLSWGEGVQSDIVPTHGFPHGGQPLSSTISRQWELGYKHGDEARQWGLTAFDVDQPLDDGLSDGSFGHDGITRAIGLEANVQGRVGPLTLRASAMRQRVRREQAQDPSNNGRRPTNIPDQSLKIVAAWDLAPLPGLSVLANMDYEGGREVLPDNSVQIPGWTSYGLGARYTQPVGNSTLVWRAGVDNLFDRRAWREAPYQYEHAYLFPLAPRTFHASLEAKF
ncbi:MAG: TonB-dependent siderophore receptor [Vitreoscilla sp.]